MRYWDTSAVVPLILNEPGTKLVRAWLKEDEHIVTWALTRIEIISAIERRAAEGALSAAQRRTVLGRFERLWTAWDEVTDLLAVRKHAGAVLARHRLRASDALQLASTLLVAGADQAATPFVCLDRNLAGAADREGLTVLSWPDPD